jgi:hypothetical protein
VHASVVWVALDLCGGRSGFDVAARATARLHFERQSDETVLANSEPVVE